MTFRVPDEEREYLKRVKRSQAREYTEIMLSALRLDRDLAAALDPDRERLQAAADRRGLTLGADLPQVLAELIRLGLDADERRKK